MCCLRGEAGNGLLVTGLEFLEGWEANLVFVL